MRLIDADAEIERLESDFCKKCERRKPYPIFGVGCCSCGIQDAVEIMDNAPEIKAEPVRHGRWSLKILYIGGDDKIRVFECSECSNYANMKCDFCPNCGAKMGGAENAAD